MCGNDRPRELFATATGLAVTRVPDVARHCCVYAPSANFAFFSLRLYADVFYTVAKTVAVLDKSGKRAAR